jgi:hypothetical protein
MTWVSVVSTPPTFSDYGEHRGVAVDEVPDVIRHWVACHVAAILDHPCDIFGHVISPMLQRVEGHYTTGSLNWPDRKSSIIVSRSVRSTSVSR